MVKFLIEGFKWFDKVNGNTYFTLKITDLIKNEVIFKDNQLQYGYDEHYKEVAYKELIKLGLVKKEDQHNHNMNRERFIYRESHVLQREAKNI